jgi:hypothetical protein
MTRPVSLPGYDENEYVANTNAADRLAKFAN